MILTRLLEILRKPQLALNILNTGSVARKTVTAGRKRVVLEHLTGKAEVFWEVVGVGQSNSVGAGLVPDYYKTVRRRYLLLVVATRPDSVLLAIIGALGVGVEKDEEKKGGWEDGS
ncbi:hypothetical protein PENPOL_c004G10261 [Penicillium polonicum]|uniref:Uncharacterized protein n=1 Tax=Penicillium polonicum TaxID=60169 RepID=A0A1V6NQT2_PENPO|nr:hypothetical protein PENPOL_c004G10261 [Penicillium polonicum]